MQCPEGDALYNTAKYTVHCANTFFRICRGSGIFISGDLRDCAVKYGMDMNDSQIVYGLCVFPFFGSNATQKGQTFGNQQWVHTIF